MKQPILIGGKEVVVDFSRLKEGDSFGDWEYVGNSTEPGNPLWSEFRNIKTGESSLREHTPKTILTTDKCNHRYKHIDSYGNVQCEICEDGRKIITGYHILKDGKIHTLIPPKKNS